MRKFDVGSFGKNFEGFLEIDILHFHDEREDISADVTNPAFKGLTLGIDLETWTRIVVPRAAADIVSAAALQRHNAGNQFHNINCVLDLLFDMVVIAIRHFSLRNEGKSIS